MYFKFKRLVFKNQPIKKISANFKDRYKLTFTNRESVVFTLAKVMTELKKRMADVYFQVTAGYWLRY